MIPKCKIWDTKEKRWISITEIGVFKLDWETGGIEIKDYDDPDLLDWIDLDLERYKVCWYTQFSDKNNNEIYDHTIVRVWSPFYKNYSNELVFWDDEGQQWFHTYRDRPAKQMWSNCRVIGHFYQNERLLDKRPYKIKPSD